MGKLYFYYGAMNAGKSTHLIQAKYNYEERGMLTQAFTPIIDNRYGRKTITSRTGCSMEAIEFSKQTIFNDSRYLENKISCWFVDEAQFLTMPQVKRLLQVSYMHNIPVLCYGLRVDFRGELFEGSKYLLAWADKLIEIKSICHCGKKATMNARIDANGNRVCDGEQIEVGGNDRYVAFCAQHFWENP